MKLKLALTVIFCIIFSTVSWAEKTIQWTMVSPLTQGISYIKIYKQMCEEIEAKSNGRLKIKLLTYGEHPYKNADILNAVKNNIVQIGNTADVYISSSVPSISIMSLPFRYNDLNHAKAVFKEMLPGHFNPLVEEKYGSSMLTGFLISGSAIHANIPLNSLKALDGRKIRVFNKESGKMVSLLGGTPVTISFGELYTALQRGTIDGCLTGMIGAEAAKIYEVVKHCTWWSWSFPYEFTMINNKALNALPQDLQQIVKEVGAATSLKLQTHQDRVPAEILVSSIEDYGINAHGLSAETKQAFKEKTNEITETWLEKTGDNGKRAFSIYQKVTEKLSK